MATTSEKARFGVILGSGLGAATRSVENTASVPHSDISELPLSTVPGHAGEILRGHLGGVPALVAVGRVHLYEGRSPEEITAMVRWMAAQGVEELLIANAAGALRSEWNAGDWMLIEDHLNLTGHSPLSGGNAFVDMTEPYDPSLRRHISNAAENLGIKLRSGIYASLPGPQYETPAEVRMLRTLGADAVGMSTVLEVIQARALGLKVAGLSLLTNHGAGLAAATLDHEEVLNTGKTGAEILSRLLPEIFSC